MQKRVVSKLRALEISISSHIMLHTSVLFRHFFEEWETLIDDKPTVRLVIPKK